MNNAIYKWGRKWQPRHYRNVFQPYEQNMLIVLTDGSLRVEYEDYDGKSRLKDLYKGEGLCLPLGSSFCLSTPLSAYNGHWVEYDTTQEVAFPSYVEHFACDAQLQRCINEIEQEHTEADGSLAMPILYQLLGCRCLQRLQAGQNENASLQRQIDVLLIANCRTDASLSSILGHLSQSERHIRRQYKALTGQSIKQRMQELKMTEAKHLLAASAYSITAIAFELGYPSSQYFSGLFKKITGMTPRAYRSAAQK